MLIIPRLKLIIPRLMFDNSKNKVGNSKIKVGNSKIKVGNSKFEIDNSDIKVDNSKINVDNFKIKVGNSKIKVDDSKINVHNLKNLIAPDTNLIIQRKPAGGIISGNKVNLTCITSGGNPLASLSWNCSGTNTNYITENTVSYSVDFTVDKSDNKLFTCSATHPVTSYTPQEYNRLIVLEEAFNDSLDKSLDSIDIETESSPAHDSMDIREEEAIPVVVQKTFETTASNTDATNMTTQKFQTDSIPQRTRRLQKRKSKGIQCNPSDIDSECLVATSKKLITANTTSSSYTPVATEQNLDDNDEMDNDEDDVDEYDNDPDYIDNESEEEDGDDEYGSDDDVETSNYRMEEYNDPIEEKYYMVSETALFQLLSVC
ncbi:unnamed protein product [Mytilus coruscus]|uniref:Ig-like domain-containing protein n=1 Tax=Mytilus coruscus TaxID=42192 RepID=A0A6J8CP57_MYTCO|nr:unnamed protein product [Mytilus coruscus]